LMTPMTLEVSLAVQGELQARAAETDGLRRQHIERTRYDADLARRRYMKVDPDLGSRSLGTQARSGVDNPLNKLAFAVGRSGIFPNS
jgi:hypothetical protein